MRISRSNLLYYPSQPAPSAAVPKADEPVTSTRLTLGRYFADIVPGGDELLPVFHWVIQRVGSPEILRLGQEASFAHAVDRAHECLEDLAQPGGKTEKRRMAIYEFGELK
jgi:hypothetical protein